MTSDWSVSGSDSFRTSAGFEVLASRSGRFTQLPRLGTSYNNYNMYQSFLKSLGFTDFLMLNLEHMYNNYSLRNHFELVWRFESIPQSSDTLKFMAQKAMTFSKITMHTWPQATESELCKMGWLMTLQWKRTSSCRPRIHQQKSHFTSILPSKAHLPNMFKPCIYKSALNY